MVPSTVIEQGLLLWRSATEYERSGPAFTCRVGGRILFCAGIAISYEGVGNGWFIPSAGASAHPFAVHRLVSRYLSNIIRYFKLRRVQIVVDADFETGLRWVRRLGFVREGLLRKAGLDGKDQVLYARVS